MNIGICGGTFDPFHRGHLDPLLAVREELQWDRVLYIPAYVQPFKQDRVTAPGPHRFAMAVLATEGHDALYVSPQELERGAVSYTVDTLQQLRREHPEAAQELEPVIAIYEEEMFSARRDPERTRTLRRKLSELRT